MVDPSRLEIIEYQEPSRSLHRSLTRRGRQAETFYYDVGCVTQAHARSDSTSARARIAGAAMVAHEALERTAALSKEEADATARLPFAEPRFRAIVDGFAVFASGEVARGVCR
jgi:hypothetical protein